MELKNVSKIYKLKDEEIAALKAFSYKFESGKLYGIKGHSGSGKSTLINILGLLEIPTSGTYILDKKDVSKLNSSELANLRLNTIGFVFQDYFLDENMTALENVMLPLLINKKLNFNEKSERAKKLLNEVGLENRIKHFPKELSGGEKQRVAIARAIANKPKIILADEPTGNLDEENEKIIFEQLKKLTKDGKCVIVVSHSDEINNYADEIIKISKGKKVGKNEDK